MLCFYFGKRLFYMLKTAAKELCNIYVKKERRSLSFRKKPNGGPTDRRSLALQASAQPQVQAADNSNIPSKGTL